MISPTNCSREIKVRKVICNIIASLDSKADYTKVASLLQPIFNDYNSIDSRQIPQGERRDETDMGSHDCDGNPAVTPLMLACDKYQFNAIRYMNDQYNQIGTSTKGQERKEDEMAMVGRLIGHPFDVCHDAGNMAAHYAAFSAASVNETTMVRSKTVCETFDALLELLISRRRCDHQKHDTKGDLLEVGNHDGEEFKKEIKMDIKQHPFSSLISLLMQENRNGDTPIMILCANGNHHVLDHLLHSLEITSIGRSPLTKQRATPWKTALGQIRTLLSVKNSVGDSALSFACGYGHIEMVLSLTKDRNPPRHSDSGDCDGDGGGGDGNKDTAQNDERITRNAFVQVTYNDVKKAESILQKTDAFLSLPATIAATVEKEEKEGIQECRRRRDDICRCLDILQSSFAQISQRAMDVLLLDERIVADFDGTSSRQVKKVIKCKDEARLSKKGKRKGKRRKKRRGKKKKPLRDDDDDSDGEKEKDIVVSNQNSSLTVLPPAILELPSSRSNYCSTIDDATVVSTADNDRPITSAASNASSARITPTPIHEEDKTRLVPNGEDEETPQQKHDRLRACSSPNSSDIHTETMRKRVGMSYKHVVSPPSLSVVSRSDSDDDDDNNDDGDDALVSQQRQQRPNQTRGQEHEHQLQPTQLIEPQAVLESLCIHPSMLLLCAAGMAEQLSVCQLDVVESVLRDQLDEVEKAKNIHRRLLSK